MKKLKLYVETSVWGFLFADDAPEKKAATELFFKEIESERYEIFISETVRAEFRDAADAKRHALHKLVEKYNPILLETDEEVRSLAEAYVQNGVLTRIHFRDLLHLAHASVNGMKALISWNQKHLVKMRTYDLVNATNRIQGYYEIQIHTPQEVINIEED
ncbi:MAG: PIN domain-containing protein [bacterium]